MHSCPEDRRKGKDLLRFSVPMGEPHTTLDTTGAIFKDYTLSLPRANFMADILSVRDCDRAIPPRQDRFGLWGWEGSDNGLTSSI